jgi:ATP-dependent Zn protease
LTRLLFALTTLVAPLGVAAQEAATKSNQSPLTTALITWVPFLFLIALWWFFFKRMRVFGKGGYGEYMSATRDRMEKIETHLADIAASLRKIAETQTRQSP